MVAKFSLRSAGCAALVALLFSSSCNVFQAGRSRPRTALDEREFVDVYVALARATQAEEKRRVLEKHGTSTKELEDFVVAYSRDLPALSVVFDSIVANLGAQPGMEVPTLPY